MENFFKTESILDEYDTVIIGAGPAGVTAAIYTSRDGLSTLVLEKFGPGGQMATTSHIENYPGFAEPLSGGDIADKFYEQGIKFGAEMRYGICSRMEMEGNDKLLYIEGREKPIRAKTLIIATGCTPKKLGISGEDKFWGRGVSSCGTCDGGFYKDNFIVAVGGGNTALEESDYLTRFAEKVYLVHRRKEFRASKIAQKLVQNNEKVELVLESAITAINGDTKIESVYIKNIVTGEVKNIKVDGVFVFVGQNPQLGIFEDLFDKDESGFVIAGENTVTKVPGVFVAGDVRSKEIRQIVTATADGAVAAKMALKFIQESNA